ncbi:MAG: hypothetical protein HKN62_06195 [Phycisphaerales bacterium]|nr:hypothetical protein [Phycisphaerales bacterium]
MPRSTLNGLAVSAGMLASVTALAQPTLEWETVISVTPELIEGADDMVVDAAGHAIVTGYLPVERDFFVLKLDPDGELMWMRTIGGEGLDHAGGIAVDEAGDIFVAGRSLSDDFPTRRAYQGVKHGPSDAILMKLDGDDGSTIFSTYFGGSRGEWAYDIALGPGGTIVIAGQTDSIDLETVDPVQDQLTLIDCFCEDAFVTQFSPNGDAVLFSTYLGGTFDDVATAVRIDADGAITIAGRTRSHDFPAVAAMQPAYGGGEFDAFVARFDADHAIVYSTFLGGEKREIVQGLDIGADGAAFVAGSTRSPDFPTTPGVFQPDFVGGILSCEVPFGADRNCDDMFVTTVETDGTIGYSTFVGGQHDDEPRNLVVDDLGRAHVIGYTYSHDFPLGVPFGSVVALRLDAAGSAIEQTIVHDTPGPNAGSAVALDGGDVLIAASVGLPYDTYVARYRSGEAADLDGDGVVGFTDLLIVLSSWGPCPDCPADLDGDGSVGLTDLLAVLAGWTGS